MPKLVASGHRVVALDPRGVGDSDRPADGYDLGSLAADIHGVVEQIGLLKDGPIAVAGHGIGTWLGYAYAADWRDDVRQLVVMNACVPASKGVDSQSWQGRVVHWRNGALPQPKRSKR